MNNQQSSSNKFLVLADSHAKFIAPTLRTSSYSLITRSTPGFKWIDNYDPKLSVYALLSLPEIQSLLSQAKAVLFLVGTNSVRMPPAKQIISQIQEIILSIQKDYPRLNEPEKILISLTFPCFKINHRYPTERSLMSNINVYNKGLITLSTQLKFNILDFHITSIHLAHDTMHLHYRFRDRIINSTIDHFDQIFQRIQSTTANQNPSLTSTSSSTSNQTQPAKKSKSRAVLDKKNEKTF